MAITKVTSGGAYYVDDQSYCESPSLDTSGADLIVVTCSGWSDKTFTVADNKSNSYTGLTRKTASGGANCQLFYSIPTTVGSGHIVNVTTSTGYGCIAVIAFMGAATTSVFDQQAGATTESGTSLATGSVSPSEDNEVIIAGMSDISTASASISDSMTLEINLPYPGGKMAIRMAYKIQTTAASINPTFSYTNSGYAAACAATFRALAAPATRASFLTLLGVS